MLIICVRCGIVCWEFDPETLSAAPSDLVGDADGGCSPLGSAPGDAFLGKRCVPKSVTCGIRCMEWIGRVEDGPV